jgi:hypothetical protein
MAMVAAGLAVIFIPIIRVILMNDRSAVLTGGVIIVIAALT